MRWTLLKKKRHPKSVHKEHDLTPIEEIDDNTLRSLKANNKRKKKSTMPLKSPSKSKTSVKWSLKVTQESMSRPNNSFTTKE